MTISTLGPAGLAVRAIVPMAHVLDVERSIRFYERLGFVAEDRLKDEQVVFWAWLRAGEASLMLSRASGMVPADVQAILFYMYSDDPLALRAHLLASGVPDGGAFGPTTGHAAPAVFEPTYPFWMQRGEVRVADPDGYCILIGWKDRLPARVA